MDENDLPSKIAANIRPWPGYWAWRDKPVGELGAASTLLREAGIKVDELASRRDDLPDCEGMLDGQWSAIEVTELVHRKVLERSLKAIRERTVGREPKNSEAYFVWDRASLLNALQELIETKDTVHYKGGPYERYVLAIHTDEFFLNSATVRQFLEGAVFHARLITDVIVGLSYEPSLRGCPVFLLELTR
jgi:hypothetical protein